MDIKQLFSKRILEAEKEAEAVETSVIAKVPSRGTVRSSLREADVGITEYVSQLPGFRGIIKQRYSDFNVHEIDKEGNIVILNSSELPDESLGDHVLEQPPLDNDMLEKLEQVTDGGESAEIDVTEKSKSDRKRIHEFVKGKYGSSVISSTVDREDRKLIIVEKNKKGAKEARRAGHLPKYLHFVLSKANIDTTSALSVIGSKIRIKIDSFHMAGLKDKRANTSQRVSIKNAYAKTLNNIKGLRSIWLGNFAYKDYGLSLGDLKGNNFQIALRNLDAPDEVVENSLSQLKESGFINYFGMQRFGNNAEAATHEIGRFLLKEEFKLAVETILKPRNSGEPADIRSAREIYAKTHDAGQALSALKYQKSVEGKVLEGLKRNGANAFVNALDCLPRNIQLLYLHAYQAFLWNKVASRRISTHGLAVLAGDLVYIDSEEKLENVVEDEIIAGQEEKPEIEPQKLVDNSCRVRQISEEEIGKFNIYDIVLPNPGANTLFPNNEIFDWFREELQKDGLTIESLKGRIKKYSIGGGYRKILKKPKNLSWRFVRYSRPEEDLILSDAEIMAGKTLPVLNGPLRAVVLKLDLDSSVYATMALREILRIDTSCESQSQLNEPNMGKRPAQNDQKHDVKKFKTLQ